MRNRKMQDKQRLIYEARIRQGWLMEAKRLGSVAKACKSLGAPKSTYYYWHKRWINGHKTLKSLMDTPKTPKEHINDPNEELVSLVVQLRLGLMYSFFFQHLRNKLIPCPNLHSMFICISYSQL